MIEVEFWSLGRGGEAVGILATIEQIIHLLLVSAGSVCDSVAKKGCYCKR